MDILSYLNRDLWFPVIALLVIIIYIVTRVRNKNRFKR